MFGRCGRPALVSIHAPSLHVHGAPRKLCTPGHFGQAGQAVGLCRLGRGPGRNSQWLRSQIAESAVPGRPAAGAALLSGTGGAPWVRTLVTTCSAGPTGTPAVPVRSAGRRGLRAGQVRQRYRRPVRATRPCGATRRPVTDVASEVMSIGTAGPSNPESVGFQSAIDAIAAAIARALHRPHPRVISAVLAIAGINNLSEQQRILSSLPMVPAADLAAQVEVVYRRLGSPCRWT